MSIAGIIVSGWLTFGVLPRGAIALYDAPMRDLTGSFVTALGVEARWDSLFLAAEVEVPVWFHPRTTAFFPNQASFMIEAGLALPNLRLAWRHDCAHPVVPGLASLEIRGAQLRPRWESAYDMIYVTIGGRTK